MSSASRVVWPVLAALLPAGCATAAVTVARESEAPIPLLSTDQVLQPILSDPAGVHPEARVDISTEGRGEDVRPLLDFVASAGGLRLLYPPALDRKVIVELHDVPVSMALHELLRLSGLSTESIRGTLPPTEAPDIVFYQLPVNVDSVSAETITRRFGVSRSVADVIVRARPPR